MVQRFRVRQVRFDALTACIKVPATTPPDLIWSRIFFAMGVFPTLAKKVAKTAADAAKRDARCSPFTPNDLKNTKSSASDHDRWAVANATYQNQLNLEGIANMKSQMNSGATAYLSNGIKTGIYKFTLIDGGSDEWPVNPGIGGALRLSDFPQNHKSGSDNAEPCPAAN